MGTVRKRWMGGRDPLCVSTAVGSDQHRCRQADVHAKMPQESKDFAAEVLADRCSLPPCLPLTFKPNRLYPRSSPDLFRRPSHARWPTGRRRLWRFAVIKHELITCRSRPAQRC